MRSRLWWPQQDKILALQSGGPSVWRLSGVSCPSLPCLLCFSLATTPPSLVLGTRYSALRQRCWGPSVLQSTFHPAMQNLEGAMGGKVYQFCEMRRKKKCKKECHLLQRLSDHPTSACLRDSEQSADGGLFFLRERGWGEQGAQKEEWVGGGFMG